MRAHDWATTPLGSPETWPQSLRSSLSVVLNSTLLGAVLWGPELRLLYNDVYVQSMGDRHPQALGQPVTEVWKETYAPIAQAFARVMQTGEGFGQEVITLPMLRNGTSEMTYWNATASPIRGEDGSIVGLMNIAIETTAQVAAERNRDIQHAMLSNENTHLVHEVVNRTSERDRALEAETVARRNAERVQLALAAGAIIGTWIWDLPTDAFSVDEAFAQNFGFDPSTSRTGLSLEQVIQTVHPDDREGCARPLARRSPVAVPTRTSTGSSGATGSTTGGGQWPGRKRAPTARRCAFPACCWTSRRATRCRKSATARWRHCAS